MANRYDRVAAASYALRYSQKYNLEWPEYNGEDCTNFVSQALSAGGWMMIAYYGGRDTRAWYSGKRPTTWHSWTWSNVQAFAEFLGRGSRARRCRISELQIGDVVQLKDYNIIHHTMIVTGVLPDSLRRTSPFVTYHTRDVTQKPLNTISAEEFICWKILDVYEDPEVVVATYGD